MPELRQLTRTPAGPGVLTATVPRELVHRVAVAEVLLTGWTRTDTDRFTITAQWPRSHRLHVSPDGSAYEPLLVAETVRQCGALLAHAAYEVPLGHQFVLRELRVDTRPEHLAVGAAPAEPVIDITVGEVRRRAGRPAALRYDAVVRLGGERIATGGIAVTWTNESVYRRLRGGRTADVGTLRLPQPPPSCCRPTRWGGPCEPTYSCRPRSARVSGGSAWIPHILFSSTTRWTTSPACSSWRPPARPYGRTEVTGAGCRCPSTPAFTSTRSSTGRSGWK